MRICPLANQTRLGVPWSQNQSLRLGRIVKPKLPSLFVTHGAPLWLTDPKMQGLFGAWGQTLGHPKAILVLSAHWYSPQLSLGETKAHEALVYDFYGFPRELYQLQYPAPGAGEWVARIGGLAGGPLPVVEGRGLDHGVWVPLYHLWPKAEIPVLQLSLPRNATPRDLFGLGQRLAPLREEGGLLVGSGSMTHNLGELDWSNPDQPEPWAAEFDRWVAERLENWQLEALLDWEAKAPLARKNHPTVEHFLPLFFAAGAGWGERVSFPLTGFQFGSLSYRSAQFG